MPIHQALTRFQKQLRTILPRHEQGGGFMAQGYARSTGKVGVCIATSGPGATNFVTCLADAKMDSVPLVAITGQVGTSSSAPMRFRKRHRRGLPGDYQAPLPCHPYRGFAARHEGGFPHRLDRPARARARGCAEGCAEPADPARL